MNIKSAHKKTKCPACGSNELHTQDLDQICLDCDWTNSRLLVDLGQLDQLTLAAHHQFVSPPSFDDLNARESQQTQSQIDFNAEASA